MSVYTDKLSFQLYSARLEPPLDAQLDALVDLGYRQVEPFGGLFADLDGFVKAVKDRGLKVPSGHIGIDMLRDDFAGVVSIAKATEMDIVVCPHIGADQRPDTPAGWAELGEELGSFAARLAGEGLRFAWHNHDFEMRPLNDGSFPMDHLLSDDLVLWEADTAWIVKGGQDAEKWIRKYSGRVPVVHLKDIAASGHEDEDGWADVGHGTMPWAALAPACLVVGVEILVVEHDKPSDFQRFARRSIETVKSW